MNQVITGEMDGEKIVRPETSFDAIGMILDSIKKPLIKPLEEREMTEAELKQAEQIAESDNYDLNTCHTV